VLKLITGANINNMCPVLASGNAQASETDSSSTVMGNSRQPLPAPAQTSSPFAVHECHQDSCPGVHLVSPGLL